MKKIFALILCLMLLAIPLSVSAEEVAADEVVTEQVETETTEDSVSTITDAIVEWVEPNIEEIGVVVTLIGYGVILFKKLGTMLKSIGTVNNNTITISKENANLMAQAMASMNNAAGTVTGYDERILELLDAFKQTLSDKQKLEAKLMEIENYLKVSAAANLEFSEEFCELLSLANIPNYRKEELGKRHVAAKQSIIDAEKQAVTLLPATTEEVTEDVGEEKEN